VSPIALSTETIVLFDVMGTLVYDPFWVEVPDQLGLTFEELLAQKHPTAWKEFERGELTEQELFDRFFLDGRSFDGEQLKQRMADSYRWIDGMHPLVVALHERGVPMHVLSNYPTWYQLIEKRLRLSRYMSWRFVSCRTGVRKPRPEAYLGAARALGVQPASCLFVDDREDNCAGAEAVGMPAIRFESSARLREQLTRRGLLEAEP
jgi:HAD superfamily hydrolase (TIGR01509 family)